MHDLPSHSPVLFGKTSVSLDSNTVRFLFRKNGSEGVLRSENMHPAGRSVASMHDLAMLHATKQKHEFDVSDDVASDIESDASIRTVNGSTVTLISEGDDGYSLAASRALVQGYESNALAAAIAHPFTEAQDVSGERNGTNLLPSLHQLENGVVEPATDEGKAWENSGVGTDNVAFAKSPRQPDPVDLGWQSCLQCDLTGITAAAAAARGHTTPLVDTEYFPGRGVFGATSWSTAVANDLTECSDVRMAQHFVGTGFDLAGVGDFVLIDMIDDEEEHWVSLFDFVEGA